MLEIVVSIILLTVGTLGYAAVTAGYSRSFFLNAQRTRSWEAISSRREVLMREGCNATSGSDNRFDLTLQWSVAQSPTGRTIVIESRRPISTGLAHDSLRVVIPCI